MNAADYADAIDGGTCVVCCREAIASRCPACAETENVRARVRYRLKNPEGKRACTGCGDRGHYVKTCPRAAAK